jgi:two-component system, chemotaxis family, protein-glutamate methylesterase/glutaminase
MEKSNLTNKIIIIGGSAGSFNVLNKIVADLPSDFNIPVIIIVHRKYYGKSYLVNILNRITSLNVLDVDMKENIVSGNIYVAPPDYHLIVEDKCTLSLDLFETKNYSRPSIDVTMSSAAKVFGKNSIGVLLSGASKDGAEGLLDIQNNGGTAIVQDVQSSEVSVMPQSAIDLFNPDFILLPEFIGKSLSNL